MSPSTEHSRVRETLRMGFIDSLALIANNMSGPAMMSLPGLFLSAGIAPVVVCIVIVCISSSLCATFLSDVIASIPGNSTYTKTVDFPVVFGVIMGEGWYAITETLFLISCMVQACASIVETAQSLDSFIASFVLEKTFALEFRLSGIYMTAWISDLCNFNEIPSSNIFDGYGNLENQETLTNQVVSCIPFSESGPLILTLGFFLTTCLFLPFGFGDLKDTMIMQLLSFGSCLVLLSQFYYEFFLQGFHFKDAIPWIGQG